MTSTRPRRSQRSTNQTSPISSRKRPRSSEQPSPAQRRVATDLIENDSPTPARPTKTGSETILQDDLCPICHLLLCRPATTKCNHTLCESCMSHWADVSIQSQITIVSLDEQPSSFTASEVEAKCPMCRTQTSASLNPQLAEQLELRYPNTYEEREDEERLNEADSSVQTLTLYIGNEHRLVEPEGESANMHDWTFFVRPSRTDIIEEIQILLHPTFRPSRIIRQRPPYEIRRHGWGYFTITAYAILKAGYTWVSEDATNAPDGAPKGALPLEWGLDFSGYGGRGSMGRCRMKVKSDRGWDEGDGEVKDRETERDERTWKRAVVQYARDGRWEPDED